MRAPCNLSGRWTCRWTIVTCWCGRAYWSLTRPPTTRWGCTPCHLLSVLLGSLPDRPGVSSGVPLQASQGQLQDQDLPSKHWREGPGLPSYHISWELETSNQDRTGIMMHVRGTLFLTVISGNSGFGGIGKWSRTRPSTQGRPCRYLCSNYLVDANWNSICQRSLLKTKRSSSRMLKSLPRRTARRDPRIRAGMPW